MSSPTLLILGGSGFLSGTLTRQAIAAGYRVWTVTRGARTVPAGVIPVIVDRRDRAAFATAIAALDQEWDLVVDCIGFEPADAQQDIAVFSTRARQLVFVSTDFVYAPEQRRFPQSEDGLFNVTGYGGNKRRCEEEFEDGNCGAMAWTVFRPGHIYGPGSQLGCLPRHSRDPDLLGRLMRREPLALVGGGRFLQQPILARDLADLMLSVRGNLACAGQIYGAAGPDIIESRSYYGIIADLLDVPLTVEEIALDEFRAAHPEADNFLCHRFYDLSKLQASGLLVPATSIRTGLREHVASLRSPSDGPRHGE